MRQIAEPELERMARQAAHTAHERIVEHDVPKQLTLDGLRLDVPYAHHYCKTSHRVTVHNASNYTSNSTYLSSGFRSPLIRSIEAFHAKSQHIGTYARPNTSSIV
jgi:hypothetical protein